MAITYTPTTNFGAKDSLPTNDPDKVIKGSEFTTEFTAIQTAFGLAAPAASPTFTGTVTIGSVDINGGAIDGTIIGGATPAAGSFTTVSATGNITVGGTVDGRDVAADGTKLDGVEAGADVTDTANVTAAGALMDSELTNIAAVKALNQGVATTDSPSFAGLTATTTDINGGSVDGVTLGTNSAVTEAQIDNININGNTISSTDTNGNVTITPDGTGSVAITKIDVAGGEIDGTAIGANSASTGAFTTLNATGGGALTGTWTDLGSVTTVDINGGTIDGVTIGGSSAGAITGTTGQFNTSLNVDGTVTADGLTVNTISVAVSQEGSVLLGANAQYGMQLKQYTTDGGTPHASVVAPDDTNGWLSIEVGGDQNEAARFAANGDISFYEDTGTTPKFFWDASAESLGIGTSSPAYTLEVTSSVDSLGAVFGSSLSQNNWTGIGLGYKGSSYTKSAIIFERTDSDYARGDLHFALDSAADSGSVQLSDSKMVITSSGNVGIGTSSPGEKLSLSDTSSAFMAITNTTASTTSYLGTTSSGDFEVNASGASSNVILKTGGDEAMRIDSSGNVGIGTTSPNSKVHSYVASGNIETRIETGAGASYLRLKSNTQANAAYNGIYSDYGSSNDWFVTGGNSSVGTLRFGTNNSERMRIDSSGNLLVGTTGTLSMGASTTAGFQVGDDFRGVRTDGNPIMYLKQQGTDGQFISFYKDTTNVGRIGNPNSNGIYIGSDDIGLFFDSSANQVRPINVTTGATTDGANTLGGASSRFQDLYLSGGVYLGGTGADNLLDDYEEGTWTPTITNSTGSYTTQVGRYTKIGNLVYVVCNVITAFTNTGTTAQSIGNLPFTIENVATLFPVGVLFPVQGFNQANLDIHAQGDIGATTVSLYSTAPSTGINYTNIVSNTFGTTVEFEFTMCYRTA